MTNSDVLDFPEQPLVIGERTFRLVDKNHTTFDQDLYVLDNIEQAQLDIAFEETVTMEKMTNLSKKLLLRAWRSGHLWKVLAGVLIEENIPWTVEGAEANAVFFGNLTKQVDKEALQNALATVVVGFFASGASDFTISPKSSDRAEAVIRNAPELLSDALAVFGSGTGTSSSGSSLGTIPRNSRKS